MDAVSAALDDLRGRGAFVLRCELEEPFRIRVEDGAVVTVIAPVRGSLTIRHPSLPEATAGPGEVVVVPTGGSYEVLPVGSGPTVPGVRILAGGHCADEQGNDLSAVMWLDTRVWGTRLGGSHAFLTGSYNAPEQLGSLLLRGLEQIVTAQVPRHLVALLVAELADGQPGQAAVLDRLVDLLLTSALRSWFADRTHEAPVGWHAQSDEMIGPVLDLIHQAPDHPWSVAMLASRVGWSRASVARRFTQLVGQPPMTYLTHWRMTLAADALRRTDDPVGAVARQVGYDNPYAFSTAFKGHHGVSPRAYRAASVKGQASQHQDEASRR
ncbi:helix-turn-helix transcriptional regulator [Ornithinimicrobium pratense]|nr:AraC family transcriptional regulator [Ornithinimicrobium pratense]